MNEDFKSESRVEKIPQMDHNNFHAIIDILRCIWKDYSELQRDFSDDVLTMSLL